MQGDKLEILKSRYQELFPEDIGVTYEELERIEAELNINLPKDFKEIASFYPGGMVGRQSIFTITSNLKDSYGVTNRTKILRENIDLPYGILPLYSEYGFIYINLDKESEHFGKVIYCSTEEAQSLYEKKIPENIYQSYSSFLEFFEFLLTEEEKERQL